MTDKAGKHKQENELLLFFFSTHNMKHSNGTEQSATECIINVLMMQYVKVMAIVSAHSHSSYTVVYVDIRDWRPIYVRDT